MTADQLSQFRTMTGKRVNALLSVRPFNYSHPTEKDIDNMKALHRKAREDAKKLLEYKFSSQTTTIRH